MATCTRLRHIHLKITNVARAALFYELGLGMERVVTKYDGRMVIVSTTQATLTP